MSNNEKISHLFVSLRANLARAVSHIVPPKEIEDIVQETYVRICQVENQDEIRFPRSYMLKTAKNLAFDHLKRAETRLTISIDEDADLQADEFLSNPDDTFDRVAANREFSDFCEAVRQLPLQCRKAFVLKKVYGYTQKEIAQSLDISENTVEKHIATGIKRCTHYMATLRHGDAVNSAPANSTSVKEGAA